jgi:hypothetical protein
MSSAFVQFVPSTSQVFTFQPTLNGVQYNAAITWNVAGQRYYLNLYDSANNLIICRSVDSSGPRFMASFSWAQGFAVATTALPHNVPVGSCANMRASETQSPYDGDWQVISTSALTLSYTLPNPNLSTIETGTIMQPLNLVEQLGIGWLLFHYDTQQFEFESA